MYSSLSARGRLAQVRSNKGRLESFTNAVLYRYELSPSVADSQPVCRMLAFEEERTDDGRARGREQGTLAEGGIEEVSTDHGNVGLGGKTAEWYAVNTPGSRGRSMDGVSPYPGPSSEGNHESPR